MRAPTAAEMRIETQDGALIVSWRGASRHAHDAWLATLRGIRGAAFDRQRLCWVVPAQQADRIYAAFPQASYSYDAICLIEAAQRRRNWTLYRNLIADGLHLAVVDGRVVASGAAATPVLQAYLDARPEFAQFVQALTPAEIASVQASMAAPPPPAAPTNVTPEAMRQGELLAASLHNAAANQYRAEKIRQARRRNVEK